MSRHRYYVLAVLALVAVLNTADQAVLVVSLPAIQLDFRLTDTEVGLVSGAFVVVYAVTVLISGHLADRVNRRSIIAAGVFAWSLATLLTGFTRSFSQMLLARAALGIGESTTLPSSISILGDYFTKRERGRATAILGAALQVGAGLGALAGGVIAARYGWRSAFYLAALPGVVLAGFALTMCEPSRGSGEPTTFTPLTVRASGWNSLVPLIRIRTFATAAIANSFVWFAITGVAGFMGLYISRRFGVDLARVGVLLAPPLMISGLAGNTVGGWLVDRRARNSPRAHLEVAAGGCLLGSVGMMAVFNASSQGVFEMALILAATGAQMAIPGLLAVNQNVVLPSLRGSATALQQLATNLLGRGGGLIVIGLVADGLHDLRLAFLFVAPTALALAALFALAGFASIERDTATMEATWAGRSAERPVETDLTLVRKSRTAG